MFMIAATVMLRNNYRSKSVYGGIARQNYLSFINDNHNIDKSVIKITNILLDLTLISRFYQALIVQGLTSA